MQRIAGLLAVVVIGFSLVGCPGWFSGGMEKEAENAAMQELGKYVVKCGEDEYNIRIKDRNKQLIFEQYKTALIYINETTTEADRLNGFEWKGGVNLKLDVAYRRFGPNWSAWEPLDVNNPPTGLYAIKLGSESGRFGLYVSVEKRKGSQWKATLDNPSASVLSCEYEPITCSDVPGTKENDARIKKEREEADARLKEQEEVNARKKKQEEEQAKEVAAFLAKSSEEQTAEFPKKSPELQEAIRRQVEAMRRHVDTQVSRRKIELDNWMWEMKRQRRWGTKEQEEYELAKKRVEDPNDDPLVKADKSQRYLSELLDVKGSFDELKAAFESRFKQKTKVIGVNPDSYASDVTFIENLISACAHSQCAETNGFKKVSNENKRALIYSIVDTGKTNSGLIMHIKFDQLPEDQFKPERDDIFEITQRTAKYAIISCFFDGARALR
jgi:hypothetical protein